VNDIVVELDGIRREQRRCAKGKPRPQTKRVDLSRHNFDLPLATVFPCMVDQTWYQDHIDGTPLEEELELYEEDPEGFREGQSPQPAASSDVDQTRTAHSPSSSVG
jgi:hypothetical protein